MLPAQLPPTPAKFLSNELPPLSSLRDRLRGTRRDRPGCVRRGCLPLRRGVLRCLGRDQREGRRRRIQRRLFRRRRFPRRAHGLATGAERRDGAGARRPGARLRCALDRHTYAQTNGALPAGAALQRGRRAEARRQSTRATSRDPGQLRHAYRRGSASPGGAAVRTRGGVSKSRWRRPRGARMDGARSARGHHRAGDAG